MALNAAQCADGLLGAIAGYAYMNYDGTFISDENGKPKIQQHSLNISDYASQFADAYHMYASQGLVLGATNGDGEKSILASMIEDCASYGSAIENIQRLAQGFADYWATVCVTPGSPAHGGTSVVGVVNDSQTRVNQYYDAIVSSYRNYDDKPYFYDFVMNIESVVKTVIWTVSEVIPDQGVKTFPETIV